MKADQKHYASAVRLLCFALYFVSYTPERVRTTSERLLAAIPQMRRDGSDVIRSGIGFVRCNEQSMERNANFARHVISLSLILVSTILFGLLLVSPLLLFYVVVLFLMALFFMFCFDLFLLFIYSLQATAFLERHREATVIWIGCCETSLCRASISARCARGSSVCSHDTRLERKGVYTHQHCRSLAFMAASFLFRTLVEFLASLCFLRSHFLFSSVNFCQSPSALPPSPLPASAAVLCRGPLTLPQLLISTMQNQFLAKLAAKSKEAVESSTDAGEDKDASDHMAEDASVDPESEVEEEDEGAASGKDEKEIDEQVSTLSSSPRLPVDGVILSCPCQSSYVVKSCSGQFSSQV